MLLGEDIPGPVHPASLAEEELLKQCDLGKGRGSGPGGQHRNKVETQVTLTHTPTGIQARAGERRSAGENHRVALFRLRLLLATRVRTPVAIGEARSDLWRSRCSQQGRIACNPEHHDFPAMLAEALNMLEATALDPRKASLRLCCSMSQLVKLVKEHPPAFQAWNKARQSAGMSPLK
jgi:hypothetical protein